MVDKKLVYLAIGVGGFVGSYTPVLLFRVDGFSIASIVGGLIGSVVGLVLAYKFIQ
jgi:uncharacterized membrane protein YeaQ/YmgE (transglycosylase-associated protein family)